jgi:hypothetical protein
MVHTNWSLFSDPVDIQYVLWELSPPLTALVDNSSFELHPRTCAAAIRLALEWQQWKSVLRELLLVRHVNLSSRSTRLYVSKVHNDILSLVRRASRNTEG